MIRFASVSDANLIRAIFRLQDRIRRAFGYQPWGIDRATLAVVAPGFLRDIDAIKAECHRRVKAGVWTSPSI